MKYRRFQNMAFGALMWVSATAWGTTLTFSELSLQAGKTFATINDEQTHLQWLSPRATQRLSISSVVSSEQPWLAAGFRYASAEELGVLLMHAGYDAALAPFQASNVKAVQGLISGFGATYVNNLPSPGNPFGQQEVYGILSDLLLGDGHWPASHRYVVLGASDTMGYAGLPGGQWLYESADGAVGSFLVRVVAPVPEPAVYLQLLALCAVLAVSLRVRQTAVHNSTSVPSGQRT